MSFFNNKGGNSSSPSTPVSPSVESFIATANQTVFNLTGSYQLGENSLQVIVGGVRQFAPKNFTETSNTSFTLSKPLAEGIEVIVIY